ncbi:MAG: TlpA family protein disulfide reductase [Bacteroidetes bacterium]|nr:TlpA family protein disulfide reductase [Bacteroidota bacterium]MBK9481669.1 TlpA family protein disulfide reductase [Bacteroidota bacterium]
MRKLLISAFALFSAITVYAQNQELPTTMVRDINGKQIPFNETFEKGKVTLVSFWACWCIPCKQEIKNIKTKLPEWQKEVDFNYMAVSIDDSRNTAMVKTYSKSQGWTFPVYLDPNSDLKRSLNFQNVPYSMIVDRNGNIVFEHTGYEEGSENQLFAKVKEIGQKK